MIGGMDRSEFSKYNLSSDADRSAEAERVLGPLKEGESWWRSAHFQARLLDAVGEAVIALDMEGRVVYWNRAAERMYGWSSEEAIGRNLREMVVPENCRGQAEEITRHVRETGNWSGEFVVWRKDGTSFPVMANNTPVHDEGGNLVGIVGVLRDITERVRAEEALKESEAWFRSLIQYAADLTIVAEADTTIRYISPSVERAWGYKPEEVIGTKATDRIHPEDLQGAVSAFTGAVEDSEAIAAQGPVIRYLHKDGSWRYMEGFANNLLDDPHVSGLVFNSRDVTERVRAEEALREGEQLFRHSFEDAAIGMALVALDGHWLRVNRALCDIVGFPEQELLSNTFQEITHPDDLNSDLDYVRRLLDGEIRTYQMEKRYLHKEGHVVWILLSVTLVHDEEGGPVYFISQIQDITEHRRAEERLRRAESRYRTLVERMPAVVYIQEIGSPDSAMYMSPQIETLTGYSPEECKDPDLRWLMVHPEDRERLHTDDERTGEPGDVYTTEYRVVHRDGRTVWVRNESVVVEEEGSGSRYWQGFMVDITERKRSEGLVRQQAALLEQTHDAVFMWKLEGEITYWNQGAERLYGWPKEEALGRASHELLKTIHPFVHKELVHRLRRDGHWEGELVHHARDGRRVVVESRHVLAHYDSEPGFVLETNRDITERKALGERLRYQAHHDLLTDLPNRQLFLDRLGQALRHTRRHPGSKVALVFVDLDNFKVVNDSLGHEVGDLLLVRVGERLRRCLRPDDTLSRFGGDEFAMLLENVRSLSEAVRVAERIIEELRNAFVLEGRELVLRASVGIAMGHDRSKTPEELLKDADTAMYRAKEDGVGYMVFEPKMYEQALKRLKVENDMRRAIEAEEFVVHYQPIVDLKTGEAWGSEALVRWEHPERGLLDPSQFVPVAEETGLIVPLGERVIEQACRQAVKWHRKPPKVNPPVVCVNLSAKQLRRQDLAETVERVLRRTGLEGACLCLDITETLYVTILESNATVLDDLKRMGVRISIDDFGVGYSSLSYLKRLPADTLKIDKSFVAGLGEDVQDTAIVRMLVDLAHTLGMKIVAEGVESEEQAEQLNEMGCDLAQGFYFAEPLPVEEATGFLSR
jgi:diguanylate cyclase (GGDEF)-like protein/PAS domain S-box-containing protein